MARSKPIVSPVKKPKQDRSRASFDRVLDAAIELIKECGYDNFTLTEVSQKAGTSIGSIYCRVSSKEDLMHAVQTRVFEGMTADTDATMQPAKWKEVDLARTIRFLIRETAELLRRHAPVLRAFTSSQPFDRMVTTAGREWHIHLARSFEGILLQRRDEIRHGNPQYAASFCFDVTYAALSKYLGIGIIPDFVTLDNWSQLADELGTLFSMYLLQGQLVNGALTSPKALKNADPRSKVRSKKK